MTQKFKAPELLVCEKCKGEVSGETMTEKLYICPHCGAYNKMPARLRIESVSDRDSFREFWHDAATNDPLKFPSYAEKLKKSRSASGEDEGVLCGVARIGGEKTCIFAMEPKFMMGSMGSVVGDKLAALFEYAVKHRLPVVGYAASGGARMQEGMVSLMQMAKVSGAIKLHNDAGLFYAVCLTDPTTGGVTASFAMLGDMIIAEPHALIGFAGKRVIEQVTGEKLPEGFQSAEFQLENGFLDTIVKREDQKEFLAYMLRLHAASGKRRA